MDDQHYPDPFQDATQHGLRQALQFATYIGTGAQIYLHHRRTTAAAAAERDDRARRALHAQIRAEREAARAGWAPALDPQWLRTATLIDTARVWGAAMPYADRSVPWYEPTAATAVRKTEDRLRDLHPHAMARYDRLRGDGVGPAEAMHEVAPFFARPTRVYDGPSIPKPALGAGAATAASGEGQSTYRWEREFPYPIKEVVTVAARAARNAEAQTPAAATPAQQPATSTQPRP